MREKLRATKRFYAQTHRSSYYEIVLGVIIYLRSAQIKMFDISQPEWAEIDDMNDLENADYVFRPDRRLGILGMSRDELISILWAENILARRYSFPGCHRSKPYDEMFPGVAARLPQTERLCSRIFCLPNGQTVSDRTSRAFAPSSALRWPIPRPSAPGGSQSSPARSRF